MNEFASKVARLSQLAFLRESDSNLISEVKFLIPDWVSEKQGIQSIYRSLLVLLGLSIQSGRFKKSIKKKRKKKAETNRD